MSTAGVFLRSPTSSDLATTERWLEDPKVNRWFDFGQGRKTLNRTALLGLARNSANVFRVFSADPGGAPVGLVVVQDVRCGPRCGHLWVIRGRFDEGGKDITFHAVVETMRLAFCNGGASSVNIWIAEMNWPSIALSRRVGFKEAGRLRGAHLLDGRRCDRLVFDMLAEEFRERHGLAEAAGETEPMEQSDA
ncbi:MAG: GNAT family N-acetyltransferase [Alphaproteobacteria bacterium]|jgi:RimJ/RimL family protein N-acetyltransferase|nr:GNAT family N-acetyltransferase [Alphaproteobacteria bacterium]MBU1550111.1 GNAT family N-acetyltransferase [Alphaproteobacteria bacterium]MBU2337087.1 GNAT family N-acetyltransferase [Alphaproteobacteria bacterium]MBU2389418.1 GNAT family N-acetyltransferase [Alphaproteobacteria bacterium]